MRAISLRVRAGESIAIAGPSGAGKSTLLALLAGLDLPSSGEVWLAGVNLSGLDEDRRARLRAQRVGFVFQSFHLAVSYTHLLAVTVLTSLDRGDLTDMGFECDVEELVISRTRRALAAGCDGVVSSALELPRLRALLDRRLLVVTPGVRPVDNRPLDDQKRVVSVAQAFELGADYIVMGRPIRDAADPRAAAEAIQQQIADSLG